MDFTKKENREILLIDLLALIVAFIIVVMVLWNPVKAVTLLTVPQGGTGAGTFTAGGILQGDGTGVIQSNIMSGDGTLSASGVLTVSVDAVGTITVEGKAAEDIDIGEAVYISGAVGGNAQFSLADNTVDGKTDVIGLAIETKTSGQTIRIRHAGQLDNWDTSAWSDGDNLYLSTSGAMVNTAPTSGTILHVADVEYDHATLGDVLLHIRRTRNKGAPASVDLFTRMGDSAGANKISYKDYANSEVGYINSDGDLSFNSLALVVDLDISDDTNLTAGRSLTLTNDDVLADSELYHHEKCFYIEDPVAADDLKSLFHFRKAATITGMWCESDQTVNMDLQLDDGTPADINGADLVCDSTPADDTDLGGDTGAGAGERLDLVITSVSGTPTWVSICFDFTYDD